MLSLPMTSRPRTSWPGSTAAARRAAAARHGGPVPDMIATAQEPKDQRPPPETSGGHSAVARSPGHPPVTASRAEMIAAASDHARQQLAPALTGIG
jgi:hypothetical protein